MTTGNPVPGEPGQPASPAPPDQRNQCRAHSHKAARSRCPARAAAPDTGCGRRAGSGRPARGDAPSTPGPRRRDNKAHPDRPPRPAHPAWPARSHGEAQRSAPASAQNTDPIRSWRTDESFSCVILVEVSAHGLPSVDRGSITIIVRASGAGNRSSAGGLDARLVRPR